MLKARNRKLSLILVLAMLMTMFAGLGTASAVTPTATTPVVATDANSQNLSALTFDFPILNEGLHKAVIKLPKDFKINSTGTTAVKAGDNVTARVSRLSDNAKAAGMLYDLTALDQNQLQLTVVAGAVYDSVKFAISLSNVFVPSGADATINATVIKLDGDFTDSRVPVGRTTGGALDLIVTDPGTLKAGVSDTLRIHVREDAANALVAGTDSLKLKLPKGVEWKSATVTDFPSGALPGGVAITPDITDGRTLTLARTNPAGYTAKNTFTIHTTIEIDEEIAEFGDIEVTVSGRSSINTTSVLLGTYKDYGYVFEVKDEDVEVVAGRTQQEVSNFKLKEAIKGSLLYGRMIYMQLPDGVEWANNSFTVVGDGIGNLVFERSSNDNSLAKAKLPDTATGTATYKFENLEVNVAVDYEGPITIEFSGSAKIDDAITVGNVIAPITAEADLEEVKIGVQGQKAGNIIITETTGDSVSARVYDKGWTQSELTLTVPYGVTWDKLPTVTVTEGDLTLGTVSRIWKDNKHVLRIPVKTSSSKASTIEISDIYYTVDRTVPEGDLKISIGGSAVDQAQIQNRTTAATVIAATVVTPAPGETIGSGEFRIGSNIYYEGGVAKVMDVAPYIKGDRTYVPMRYLGEILGAEVVWDDAARKVTLNKDEITVEFTIGSTTYTVNGEAKNADVAPEISNDRTMLPARFVAEAFGAVVGWDASTQTVLIQK